jgi:hypothetical protein
VGQRRAMPSQQNQPCSLPSQKPEAGAPDSALLSLWEHAGGVLAQAALNVRVGVG